MIDEILDCFGLVRRSEYEKLQVLYYRSLEKRIKLAHDLKQARKNDHRDERGRFKKAPK